MEDEKEIEITPEMILAGVKELTLSMDIEGNLDDLSEVVRSIFFSMTRAASS
jgi:hypothetical protein